jgi:hypothetical protein
MSYHTMLSAAVLRYRVLPSVASISIIHKMASRKTRSLSFPSILPVRKPNPGGQAIFAHFASLLQYRLISSRKPVGQLSVDGRRLMDPAKELSSASGR